MVGLVEDLGRICGQGWRQGGDRIYLLGLGVGAVAESLTLGGSEYLAVVHQTVAGCPPVVDMELEKRVQQVCRTGIHQGWVHSAHDCAEGGLAIALAEACISGERGAAIQLPVDDTPEQRWDHILFAEGGARILVSVANDQVPAWETYLQEQLAGHWQVLGKVTDQQQLAIATEQGTTVIAADLASMDTCWSTAIARRLQ
jgi:phosphoribosylformylglycinamidine synthase